MSSATTVLKISPDQMRVITPDVGGGFGTKLFPYREYALVAVAAQQLRKPVKWVADRTEHFLGDAQGRDNITTATLALDEKGKFLALEVDTHRRYGRVSVDLRALHSLYRRGVLPGVYDIPACFMPGARGLHQHGAGRRLSRRRTAGSGLS